MTLRPYLRCRAMTLLQNLSAADDLVQDTLERALACRHSFHTTTGLKAWVMSILRNLFIDGWRRTAFRVEVGLDNVSNEMRDAEEGPLDLLLLDDVRTALGALRPSERELFELMYFQHASYHDLAARFQLSPSTVGTRLFRVKAKVRANLEATYARKMASLKNPATTGSSDGLAS